MRSALEERFSYAQDATFVFHHDGQSWEYTAAELGVELDLDATVDAIFNKGRDSSVVSNLWNQWEIWRNGEPVSPIITYNQTEAERILSQLASDYINQPMLMMPL